MHEIRDIDELSDLLHQNSHVILDFYTPTCPPCKAIAPYLDELAEEYPLISFAKVNCHGEGGDVAHEYKIGAVPTFILFANGKKVHTVYGGDRKELLEAIKENFSY
jgi:thiol-disulfide isomerase/thioredoxin